MTDRPDASGVWHEPLRLLSGNCLHRGGLNAAGYKRPESVLVVICTRAGEVLMLERRHPAGYWQSVTGSLQWGEDPASAAARELYEETGLRLPVTDCAHSNSFPIHPAWRDRYQQHVTTNLEHVYRLQCEQRPDIVLNEREHVACRWLDRDRAAAVAGSATNREAILRLVTQPGRRSS